MSTTDTKTKDLVVNKMTLSQYSANKGTIDFSEEVVDITDIDTQINLKANDADLKTVAKTGSYNDLDNKPTIGDGVLTIQKNGTAIDTFSANATAAKTINIVVPTQATDIEALPSSTKYGASLDLSIDSQTYIITIALKDQDGTALSTKTLDLPLESVVVDGSYDSTNKKVILTLQSGSTIDFSIADLISGLQSTITGAASTVTDTDLTASRAVISDGSGKIAVSDTTSAELGYVHGVTSAIQTQLDNKQATISDLDTIRAGANLGATALQPNTAITSATKCKITYDTNGLVTAGADLAASDIPDLSATYQTVISDLSTIRTGAGLGATAVQSGDLAAVATSGSYNDLDNKPTIPTVNNSTITITQGGVTKGSFTTNQSADSTITLDSGGGTVDSDGKSITVNASNELQTIGVINQNDTSVALKEWSGTIAQYNAIATKDANTIYNITDDLGDVQNLDWANVVNKPAEVTALANGAIDCGTM